MPKDKGGKFHFNQQQAMASDKAGMKKATPAPMADAPTEKPMNEDAAPVGHKLMAQAHAEDGGKHMHATENPMGGYTSHHVGHDGEVQGPHDHENMEALKNHMSQFFDEEQAEDKGEAQEPPVGHAAAKHSLHGM